jgi:hypothetical protein
MKREGIFWSVLFQGLLSTERLLTGHHAAAAEGGNHEVQAAGAFLEKHKGNVSDEKVMYGNSATSVCNAYNFRYDDVIVRIPYYGNGQTGEGRVFIFLQRRLT